MFLIICSTVKWNVINVNTRTYHIKGEWKNYNNTSIYKKKKTHQLAINILNKLWYTIITGNIINNVDDLLCKTHVNIHSWTKKMGQMKNKKENTFLDIFHQHIEIKW